MKQLIRSFNNIYSTKILKKDKYWQLTLFIYLLFGYPATNFGSLLKEKSHPCNVNHRVLSFFTRRSKGALRNHGHNILSLCDILANFPLPKIESKRDYQYKIGYMRAASRVAERRKSKDLRKLGSIRKISKPCRIIAQCPVFLPK